MVKVSVIMPAYNVEDYIEKSVRSVMNQTLSDIELIIVNDASTDNTWNKILALRDEYGTKIKAVNLEQNIRQGGARNRGIEIAEAEYIAFVDSDDWIEPDMIERFYKAISENDADLAGAGQYYTYYNEEKILLSSNNPQLRELSGKLADDALQEKFFLHLGGIWRNIYKKKIIVDNNIWFPECLSYEDNYFFRLYVAYVKKYVYVEGAFTYYRQHPGSTVHRRDETQLHRIVIEKMLLSEYKARGLYEPVKDAYELACIRRWYINTLGILFNRFGKDGLKPAKEVSREFRSYFPNYKKNKYYKTLIPRANRIALTVFEVFPSIVCFVYSIKNKMKK